MYRKKTKHKLNWKNEYWKLANKFETTINQEKKISIKNDMNSLLKLNVKPTLYRYRTFNAYSLDELKTNNIYLSDPSNFNDPYDCLSSYPIMKSLLTDTEDDLLDVFSCFTNNSNDLYLLKDIYAEYISDETRVHSHSLETQTHFAGACFTEEYDSMLMWSHYANFHEGFCIEYDLKNYDFHDLSRYILAPINYSTTRPTNTGLISSIFTKSKDWSYEKEWRVSTLLINSNDNDRLFSKLKASSVILGAKMDTDSELQILKICKNKKLDVYKMELNHYSYKLNRRLIYSNK